MDLTQLRKCFGKKFSRRVKQEMLLIKRKLCLKNKTIQ